MRPLVRKEKDICLQAWGDIPDRLQLLYVWTLTPLQCSQLMERAEQILGPAPAVDPKVEICTFHSVGHGMCMVSLSYCDYTINLVIGQIFL